jgi:hypothetical protein
MAGTPLRTLPKLMALKAAVAGLALVLTGCVIAPPHPRAYPHIYPRVRVWVPFPIWFVPVGGYHHRSDAVYDRDRHECYRAAVRETGIDPGGMTPVQERHEPRGAEVAAGAAVGAVAGGIVSSPRNAGAGMVIGAILGAAAGAAAADARERAAPPPPPPAAGTKPMDEATRAEQEQFRRAMSDCMQQRGYRQRG